MQLKGVSVQIGLPFGVGSISGTWEADEEEQAAAWEMYVELVTRVAVVPLGPEEGSLREALTSLHTLFESTRRILREHGPQVARRKEGGDISFGQIAVRILNEAIRPVLATWHPALLHYESERRPEIGAIEHERGWARADELRDALTQLRQVLRQYADTLAEVAGIPPLYESPTADTGASR